MDPITFGAIMAVLLSMPDNAASSAAAAALSAVEASTSAQAAEAAADSVITATVEEIKEYLGIV